MRILVLAAWLLLVPLMLALHWGPGQVGQKLDETAAKLAQADKHVADKDYAAAITAYDEALQTLPTELKKGAARIRLERAKAMMLARKLPEAHADLQNLVEELQGDATADRKLLADARSAFANAKYYMTWLMRLEGLGRDVWEPEIEAARQAYKLLAEESSQAGQHGVAKKHREDLEAAVRLARLDLSELQGLPLPSQ
jgi:hypothetical protein